jgi:hypothetical protein
MLIARRSKKREHSRFSFRNDKTIRITLSLFCFLVLLNEEENVKLINSLFFIYCQWVDNFKFTDTCENCISL